MDAKKVFLISVFLCTLAFGQDPNAPEPVKTAQINPAFFSLDSLNVVFVEPVLEEDIEPTIWKKIESGVRQKLIDSHPELAKLIKENQTKVDSEPAQLQIITETLNPDGGEVKMFRVETSLIVELEINKERDEYLEAKVWSRCDTLRVASQADIPQAIDNLAVKHADAFAGAWLLANPKFKKAPEQSAESTEPVTDAQTDQFKYQASKYSKIFHLSSCEVTKKIKPENLLKYQTRIQAVKDSKRPCKRCKP